MKKFIKIAGLLAGLTIAAAAVAQIVINPPVPDIHINGHTYTNQNWQLNSAATLAAIANDVGLITAQYPQGRFSPRVVLTSDISLYVSTGGSDANNCLVNNPCASIQRAWDLLQGGYDLALHTAHIEIGAGNYTAGGLSPSGYLWLTGGILGQKNDQSIIFHGNSSNPAGVTLTGGAGLANVVVAQGSYATFDGVKLVGPPTAVCLFADQAARILIKNVEFGSCGYQLTADLAGAIIGVGPITFSGANIQGARAGNFGLIFMNTDFGATTTFASGASYSSAFVVATVLGAVNWVTPFTGSFTGARYYVDGNGVIYTAGQGANYFPGTQAGTTYTGGQYM
jgi:hypothetical protein